MMVQVPLTVTKESGVNDNLDRDGSRTPVDFPCGLGIQPRLNAQVVQAATKWNRPGAEAVRVPGRRRHQHRHGAIRKDYFLDHDHSSYVDQWDWERVITPEQRTWPF